MKSIRTAVCYFSENFKHQKWVEELEKIIIGIPSLQFEKLHSIGQKDLNKKLIFVHNEDEAAIRYLKSNTEKALPVILITSETEELATEVEEGFFLDALIFPFRKAEVLSKIRSFETFLLWEQVHEYNLSFSELLKQIKGDLKVVEKLHKAHLPRRFPKFKNFEADHRYLAGMKSGGEFCDAIEDKKTGDVLVLFSDSSSYGLSSVLLSSYLRIIGKISMDQGLNLSETVRGIYDEMAVAFEEKDQLSLLLAHFSLKTHQLKFYGRGNFNLFYAPARKTLKMLPMQGGPLCKNEEKTFLKKETDRTVHFSFDDRFMLLSDGFLDTFGGEQKVLNYFQEHKILDGKDFLNECTFQVKSKLESMKDFAQQDCTGLVLRIKPRVVSLHSRVKKKA